MVFTNAKNGRVRRPLGSRRTGALAAAAVLLLTLLAWAGVESPRLVPLEDPGVCEDAQHDMVAGGDHWRFETENGAVHVWRPAGFNPRHAGLVIYVHGYWNTVDEVWRDHKLAEQFSQSGRNALFVVPEAPIANEDPVRWEDLGALLDQVNVRTRVGIPSGPLVVAGHSGAIRTIRLWLTFETLDEILLLDGMYAFEDELRAWLEAGENAGVRLVMVGCETTERSDKFVEQLAYARRRADLPAGEDGFTEEERRARVLYLTSQDGHFEIITQGKLLPLLLRNTRLPPL